MKTTYMNPIKQNYTGLSLKKKKNEVAFTIIESDHYQFSYDIF